MKKSEVRVKGVYLAKVSGKLTRVRLDQIDGGSAYPFKGTNLTTGRQVQFRSAAKFRKEVREKVAVGSQHGPSPLPTEGFLPPVQTPPPQPSVLSGVSFRAPADDSPHLIVKARAGTGKTTTLISALKVLKGIDPGITPSPQIGRASCRERV